MAKKGFIKDLNNIEMLPITRGELVLDSSGKLALHSNEFLATNSLPGLMSKEDKAKLDRLKENGATTDLVSATANGLAPKIGTAAASTVTTQADEWVLTSTKGATPTWRKLPTNAFLNYYRPILVNGTSLLGNDNTALNIAAGTNINLTTDAGKVTINNGLTKVSQLTNDSGYLTSDSLNNYVRYSNRIDVTLRALYSHVGYGYIANGWKTAGPAMSFGADSKYQVHLLADTIPNKNALYFRAVEDGVSQDWKTIAFTDYNGFYNLYGGEKIPNGSDLNNYKTVGTYNVSLNADATTINNCPITEAFILKVSLPTGTVAYIKLEVTGWSSYITKTRLYVNSTSSWSNWVTTSANLDTYATNSSLSNYLPLSGGKMTTSALIKWDEGTKYDWSSNPGQGFKILPYNASVFYGCGIHVADSFYRWQLAYNVSKHNFVYRVADNAVTNFEGYSWQTLVDSNNYSGYLPFLNNGSTHATNTSVIYAPTTAGSKGLVLVSNGSGAPVWSNLDTTTSGNTDYLKIHDIRDVEHSPTSSEFPERSITAWFLNKDVPNTTWSSGITVRGFTGNDRQVWQLASGSTISLDNRLYYRNGIGDTWQPWKQIAFTDSNITGNAATATHASTADKLKTKRKLWGLDFDGTADVSGNMTGVGVVNSIFEVSKGSGNAKLNVTSISSDRDYLSLYVSSNTSTNTTIRPLVIQHGYGNVGIGVIAPSEKLEVNGNVKATSFLGNLDGTYVNKLTGYTKATSASDLAATDTLNAALGKLEYKADTAYDWYKSVTDTDTDEYINKWSEIVGFLDSVKEGTDILDEFVTRKTNLTIIGLKNFNTDTNTKPLLISRGGLSTEVVAIGVNDSQAVFEYTNDEKANSYVFKMVNTDTEGSDGSGANTSQVTFTGNSAGSSVTATTFIGKLSNTLTFSAGAFTAKTYNNSLGVTVNIPTHTSHLTNNSGFLTQHLSLANYVTLNTTLTITGQKLFDNLLTIRKDVGSAEASVTDVQHYLQLQVMRKSDTHSVAVGVMPTGTGVIWAKALGIGYNTLYLNPHSNGVAIGCGDLKLPQLNDGYYFHIFGATLSNSTITATKFIKSGGTSSQFLKADGSVDSNTYLTSHQSLANYVTLNGALTISGVKTFSTLLKFTVSLGTSPFTVTSTTVVSNLNADYWDGKHWSNLIIGGRNYYSHKNSVGDPNVTKNTSINGYTIASSSSYKLGRIRDFGFNGYVGNWTVSFEIKADSACTVNVNLCDTGASISYGDDSNTTVTTEYVKHTYVFLNVSKYNTVDSYNGFLDIETSTTNTIYVKDIKIEKGTKATDWSMAPEDIAAGYGPNGTFITANKLTTVSKTAWGLTYWTSGGVPTSISGDMTSVGDIVINTANTDKHIYFSFSNNKNAAASWRLGVLGTGNSDTNYFVILSGTSSTSTTAWTNAIRIEMDTYDVAISGNLYPLANNTKTLGTNSLRWSNIYSTLGNFSGDITLYTAGSVNSPRLIFERNGFNGTSGVDWSIYDTGGNLVFQHAEGSGWVTAFSLLYSGNHATLVGNMTAAGFVKASSSDSYVLLGGGGHKALSDFLLESELATQELSANLTTIAKSLTVTADWMDTGIKYTDLPANGTYVVQVSVEANDGTGSMYYCYWSGIMSWYRGTTNDSESDEIILHRSGHGYGNTIYLRTIMTTSTDGRHLRLLIAANKNLGAAYTYTFKFKRII